ncbi:hypothetical protein AUP68_10402 [Ilyonectria robusta]
MPAQTATEPRTHTDYTVGWVCALPKEQTTATAMLDQRHADLPKPPNDPNTYTLGSVGKHNVVIACLPKGTIGTSSAATVASWMVSTFPSIKFGLMVGIGGGVPPKARLGDVVVSIPVGQFPGVVQWDFGKAKEGGNFERTGSLNNPPTSLLTALTKLETEHELTGSKIPEYLEELKEKWPRLALRYLRSDSLQDVLFKADYNHVSENADCRTISDDDDGKEEEEVCRFCDRTKIVKRKPRDMRVHYGLIASGNQVIKDATFRDKLNKDLGGHVLCVEMEAAGLMNNFPCIIIRGICDYADSHKNKDWQGHAATMAAAFAKELLAYMQPSDADGERPVKDVLERVLDKASRTEERIENMSSNLDKKDDRAILNWITSFDYGPQQSDFFKRRQPGTGEWLLHSEEYQTWLKASKKTLFCPGIPGAGKTILTSVVIQDLTVRFSEDASIGITYIYGNFQRQGEQKVDNLLASLLKQLAESQSSLPGSVRDLYDHHKTKRTQPLLDEISRTLQSVAAMYSRIFIVVDALDELQAYGGCRTKFLSEMFSLQAKTEANLFATSRPNLEIEKEFKGCISREIRASGEDVRKYLDAGISQGESSILKRRDLQEDVTAGIVNAVDGITALRNLPKGSRAYDRAYQEAMDRLERQGPKSVEFAKQVLSWITRAKRPLTTTELQHALGVEVGESKLDEENLPHIEDMVSVCAGLVTVDEESGIIRLVHYTTQEYFERAQERWFPDVETDITKTCVTYLSFSIFESGFCQVYDELQERLTLNQLYDYAAHNWGHHARKALTLPRAVVDFLECEAKVQASSQVLMTHNRWSPNYSREVLRQMTGLHLAAYFGIQEAVNVLLYRYCPNLGDSYGRTPLWWAVQNGHEMVVKLLLENGADTEATDKHSGWTPLLHAAVEGHEAVVKLLIEKGAKCEAKDNGGRTPLLWAAQNGYGAVVKLLLENGAKTESKDNRGRTPLSWAAWGGREAVTKLLLEKGADRESDDKECGQTPLSWAARNGYEAVVELLIEKGAKCEAKDNGGRTPLLWAAQNGYGAVVKLLLENGAKTESKDNCGRTPLSRAAQNGHESVIKLLLENSAELESKDNRGRTPLLWAARNQDETVVKLLLEKGAELDTNDNRIQTLLLWAAQNGHEATVKLLFEKGADRESKNERYNNAKLLLAAGYCYEAVVKLLLEKDVNVEAKYKKSGRTPLLCAAEKGHETVVKLLLEKGANVETKHKKSSRTSLSWAAENGHKAIVKLLLDKGADLESKDWRNRTPLSWAAENGHEAVVKLLLEKGADVEAKDKYGATPLSWAAEGGHDAVVKLLLEKGADVEAKDKYGETPLSWAALRGHEAIVKLLQRKPR